MTMADLIYYSFLGHQAITQYAPLYGLTLRKRARVFRLSRKEIKAQRRAEKVVAYMFEKDMGVKELRKHIQQFVITDEDTLDNKSKKRAKKIVNYWLDNAVDYDQLRDRIAEAIVKSSVQKPKHSAIETLTNISVGYCVNTLSIMFFLPLFGIVSSLSDNLLVGACLTCVSAIKNYSIRRLFNKLT